LGSILHPPPSRRSAVVNFGEFAFDGDSRHLLREGQPLHLGPKAFDLLELLLADRPRVVSKQRIRDRLWPATFVSESTFLTVVTDLRAALRDDPQDPRFVRTVRGRGYAFCGEAREVAPAAEPPVAPPRQLRLVLEDREIQLREGENLLGRVEGGVAWIDSQWVSRRHARIVVSGETASVEDLGSKNGTFLRGRRISGPEPLRNGDEICLGRVPMIFRVFPAAKSTRTDMEQGPR
jgi:DNA-binding winged helix-turn-helix (wHTH) protein